MKPNHNPLLPDKMQPLPASLPVWKKETALSLLNKNRTPSELIVNHTLPILLKANRSLTQRDMMMLDNPNLREIDDLYCEGTAEDIISAALVYANTMLNLRDESKISDMQAQFFSSLILDICKALTLPELGLMFSKILSGQYGKFYGQIDPMELSRWCREFMKSRSEIILKDKELYKREEARIYGDKPKPEDTTPSDPTMISRINDRLAIAAQKLKQY